MNYLFLIAAGILLAALVVFIVRSNRKDRKEFEQHLNEDYRKPGEAEGENDVQEDGRI